MSSRLSLALLLAPFLLLGFVAFDPWPCPPCRWETLVEGDSGRVLLHIRDWHYVLKLLYTLDLRQQRDYSDEQIDRWYAAFLDEVEAVQRDQVALLRHLIHQRASERSTSKG